MAKGFYVSKVLAIVGILFSVAAVATIIALAVVYSQEKTKNDEQPKPTEGTHSTAATTSTLLTTTTQPNELWNKPRLPKSLIPHHYNLKLQPYLEKNNDNLYIFKGESTVFFKCIQTTNLVLIHSKNLNYTTSNESHAILKEEATGREMTLLKTWLEVSTQYLVVQAAENLQTGQEYSLSTMFTGELKDDLAGFYRSEYVEDNIVKVIATTQMQAPDARKSFPCFDEPAMKATFNITLTYKPQYVALSNMPSISNSSITENNQTWTVTQFGKTPKMSTYLLAFIVSEFDSIEERNGEPQVQIWGRKKAITVEDHGRYALNVTRPILKFLESYYNTSYPLPKSDQIALPDFSAGAMENWGLVTYRETALLYDPLVSSIGNKERVVTVIAHELAHQWFGNLVTIRWWNDLWLNEGFASYVEYLGADFAEPTWHIKDLIVLNDVHRVMAVDALASSHPLTSKEEDVNTPAEISELFDSITYSKGASVIRMLAEFLTEELFIKGLASYLKAFSYDNTVYNDLWDHLQMAMDDQTSVNLPLSIKQIMDTWVLQMGFPMVTINTLTGVITQKHFLLDPDSKVTRPSEFNYTWIVPLTYTKNGAEQQSYWLKGVSETNNTFKTSGGEWLLANINVTGYYRVNYDDGNWGKIIDQLETDHSAIPVINRAQIIDDAFNLARAKHILTTRALDTTLFLAKDVEYMPWQAALGSLNYFTQMFDRTEVYGPMQKYMKQQVTPLFAHFKNLTKTWTVRPESLTEQYNEVNAISTACAYGIPECAELTSGLFSNWMQTGNNLIHPNLRSTIYCNAVAQGGEAEWNFAWDMLNKSDIAQEADKLRSALSCTKVPWILNRLLEYSLDSSKIRRQDTVSTISSITSNVIGQSLSWDFIRANWKKIFDLFGASSFSFGNLIERVSRRFASDFELQQLEQFKLDNQETGFGTATRALEQAIERTKTNIRWVTENKESVRLWFESEIKP
ncbi:aminopeptidase N isoform X2 [Ascaphus truei]|uniref:aminopeptidase N isoform X2 n=1 Tax=Ascaphus truei TaxID=8439 RepID=UPI003F5A19A6